MLRRSVSLLSASVSVAGATLVQSFGPYDLFAGPVEGCYEVYFGSAENKMNTLNNEHFQSLMDVSNYISDDLNATARVVIFAAHEGHPFCCGLNLGTLAQHLTSLKQNKSAMPAMVLQKQHKMIRLFQDGVSALTRCRVPVICAIDGHCIGGATSLATACDFRYATVKSSFTVKEAQVGMAADIGVLQRLPAIVGEGRARELCYSARVFSAEEAKEIRFVEAVFPDRDALIAGARKSAAQIAANSPLAVQGTKHIMNQRTESAVQDSLDYTRLWNTSNLLCDDTVEAATAFAQKRPPKFSNYVVETSSFAPKKGTTPPPSPSSEKK